MGYDGIRLVFTIIVAFLVAYSATPVCKRLAYKIGAVDVPRDNRRMHKKPIPLIGGLAIFYGFIVSVLCFSEIDTTIRGMLIGSVIIVATGVIDDTINLNAWIKLGLQLIAVTVAVCHGIKIEHFTNPNFLSADKYISLGMWSIPVTFIWIVGVTNAVNLIDGLDGLAAGISSIASVSLLAIAFVTKDAAIGVLAAAVAGATFGFLPYNLHPAKIFMGDTGAMFLGYVLGCLSIMGLFKSYAVISFAVPMLILGLPLFDTSFAIIRRVLKGQSPMTADRGHIHHRLIDMGFNQKQSVLILCMASSLLSLSAVVLLLSGMVRSIMLIGATMILAVLGVSVLKSEEESEKENGEDGKN